jgi:hypothetical protein
MPFVLVTAGLLMIVTGALGTYAQFGSQVASDFTGKGNFVYWFASLFAVGAVGYIDALRTISRLFLALVIIAMVLANKGFFAQFQAAINKGPVAPAPINGATSATNTTSSGGLLGGSSILSNIWSALAPSGG